MCSEKAAKQQEYKPTYKTMIQIFEMNKIIGFNSQLSGQDIILHTPGMCEEYYEYNKASSDPFRWECVPRKQNPYLTKDYQINDEGWVYKYGQNPDESFIRHYKMNTNAISFFLGFNVMTIMKDPKIEYTYLLFSPTLFETEDNGYYWFDLWLENPDRVNEAAWRIVENGLVADKTMFDLAVEYITDVLQANNPL